MEPIIQCYNCGDHVNDYEHSQRIGRLIHCGNCGSFNSIASALEAN